MSRARHARPSRLKPLGATVVAATATAATTFTVYSAVSINDVVATDPSPEPTIAEPGPTIAAERLPSRARPSRSTPTRKVVQSSPTVHPSPRVTPPKAKPVRSKPVATKPKPKPKPKLVTPSKPKPKPVASPKLVAPPPRPKPRRVVVPPPKAVVPPKAPPQRDVACLPVAPPYTLTAFFGQKGSQWSGGFHTGQDFALPTGRTVRAVLAGQVTSAGSAGGYGNQVIIRHASGQFTTYNHLSAITVRVGARVSACVQIGLSGATGNVTGSHLHFEIRTSGDTPFDPMPWLRTLGLHP